LQRRVHRKAGSAGTGSRDRVSAMNRASGIRVLGRGVTRSQGAQQQK
jgi:hypothetical protein